MLTGTDTVAAAFATTAHRQASRPAFVAAGSVTTWAQLAGRVRLLTLGFGASGVGPGARVRVAVRAPVDRRAVEVALACLGAVRTGGTAAERSTGGIEVIVDQDLEGLAIAGGQVDEAEPDQFERRSRSVDADAPAVEDDIAIWTQRQLLWGARSVAAALAATAGDRLFSTLPPGEATGWVCGALLPILTGASSSAESPDRSTLIDVRPTLLVCRDDDVGSMGLAAPPPRETGVRALGRRLGRGLAPAPISGLEACRAALVVGAGAGAARLAGAGVPARVAVTWSGHAGLVTGAAGPSGGLGRPLPGVTIAIDDEGEVLVRSPAVAAGWARDGWLHTGWTGTIDSAGGLSAVAGPTAGGG